MRQVMCIGDSLKPNDVSKTKFLFPMNASGIALRLLGQDSTPIMDIGHEYYNNLELFSGEVFMGSTRSTIILILKKEN